MQVTGYVYFPAVHKQHAWSLMPVTLLYVGNVAFALMSLQNLNIPMYNTLKRMTPVIVLVTKVIPMRQPHITTNTSARVTPESLSVLERCTLVALTCLSCRGHSETAAKATAVTCECSRLGIRSMGGTGSEAGSACSRQCRPSRLLHR